MFSPVLIKKIDEDQKRIDLINENLRRVAFEFGLTDEQIKNIWASLDSKFRSINPKVQKMYAEYITGTITAGSIPVAAGPSSFVNSRATDDGTNFRLPATDVDVLLKVWDSFLSDVAPLILSSQIDGIDPGIAAGPRDGSTGPDSAIIRDAIGHWTFYNNIRTIEDVEALRDLIAGRDLAVTGDATIGGVISSKNAVKIRQSSTPTGTTASWDISLGGAYSVYLASSTGNVTLTTSNPIAGSKCRLDAVGQGASPRNLTLSQTGVTFMMSGKTPGSSILLDTLLDSSLALYELYWVTTTKCFVTRMTLV